MISLSFANTWRNWLYLGIALSLVLLRASLLNAQEMLPWTSPIKISNGDRVASAPLIAADSTGRLHAVWGEQWTDSRSTKADTIVYSTSTGQYWTVPFDIIAAGNGDAAVPEAFALDPFGRLLLVWRSNSGLWISTASPHMADTAQGWTTSLIEASSITDPSFEIDSKGAIHLAYIRDNIDLIYVVSQDGGVTWEQKVTVTAVNGLDTALAKPSLAVDELGGRFVAWTLNSKVREWGPAGVWFNASTDEGRTWSSPVALSDTAGHGWPDLLVDSTGRLHVIWIGNLDAGGRFHRWSDDKGTSFDPVITIATPGELRGYAGAPQLMEDSGRNLHAIFGAIGLERKDSIWHTFWDGSSWSRIVPISGDLRDSQVPSAVLAAGSQLHAAWIENSGRDIWYSNESTGSPSQPIAPPLTLALPTQEAVSQELAPTNVEAATSVPARPIPANLDTTAVLSAPSSGMVLMVGFASSALLVLAAVAIILVRRGA